MQPGGIIQSVVSFAVVDSGRPDCFHVFLAVHSIHIELVPNNFSSPNWIAERTPFCSHSRVQVDSFDKT